eukprot:CAMPEP_0117740038 /NCGR_PEP_ID=MMETSP0947-20121206/4110_1 /TAXON_ID=44440 /ORGANISM="Chattonella subsalsa, Strain CCMP2191" /LENGTH=623 /DNA_ID=CAMNT_0005556089 /DNA_START=82 /DNA_END=1953 /DNA_ORIENTATION=-
MKSSSAGGDRTRSWKPQNEAQLKKFERLKQGSLAVPSTLVAPEDLNIPQSHHPAFQSVLVPTTPIFAQSHPPPQHHRGDYDNQTVTTQFTEEGRQSGGSLELPKLPGLSNARPLDGFDLLQACGVQFPDEGRRADISGKAYQKVNMADLDYFTRLAVINASENFLALEWFCRLPALKDLRLAYNGLTELAPQTGYSRLLRLDLSYNAVTTDTLVHLATIPRLKYLDLTSNGISELPEDMAAFQSLEVLTLEHNQFDGVIPMSLAEMPKLRELYLAFNFIDMAALECAADGKFPSLDLMDLAFNYIATEQDVLPLAQLPQLTRIILYGNPLAGDTGEDPTGRCVRKFLFLAERFRQGWIERPLEVILEQPRKKVSERVNRRPYRDVETVLVDEKPLPSAAEFKEAGNQLMFGQTQRKYKTEKMLQEMDASDTLEEDVGPIDGTFVTGIDMGGELPPEDEVDDEAEEELFEDMKQVPSLLVQRPVVANQRSDPAKLQAAVTALRFALRNPITSHHGLHPRGLGGDGDKNGKARSLDRPTAAMISRSLPRRPYELRVMAKKGKESALHSEKHSLNQIEKVLDSMNERMEMLNQEKPDFVGGGRHPTGMGSLINMVNTVVDEFAETK